VALDAIDAGSLRAPSAVARQLFPVARLDAAQTVDLAHGKRVALDVPDASIVAAVTPDDRLAGLVEVTGGRARVLVNFPSDEVLA
jgi:tRNA pseudouridine55 synthase